MNVEYQSKCISIDYSFQVIMDEKVGFLTLFFVKLMSQKFEVLYMKEKNLKQCLCKVRCFLLTQHLSFISGP